MDLWRSDTACDEDYAFKYKRLKAKRETVMVRN